MVKNLRLPWFIVNNPSLLARVARPHLCLHFLYGPPALHRARLDPRTSPSLSYGGSLRVSTARCPYDVQSVSLVRRAFVAFAYIHLRTPSTDKRKSGIEALGLTHCERRIECLLALEDLLGL